jgi:DNA-binding PucR family transcriptional regulator
MNSALFDAWVAAGEPRAELADAVDSYRQAHKATRVAAGDPCVGATPLWEELGPYRTLARLPLDTLSLDDLHPGLVQLLADPAADELLHTLEVYFDAGGDARVAADSLALHRASLYQRLHKAERIAGIDIKRGDDRLALHMGLKAARLARLIPARSRS